ncbi:MAG: hypothetical protein QXP20_05690 [Candidatus Bathyarchaeia archaeon]
MSRALALEPRSWYNIFRKMLCSREYAEPLRDAAITGRLSQWTKVLTKVVIEANKNFGWEGVAKEKACDFLPIKRQEYLGLDIIVFEGQKSRRGNQWQLPVAVFELENREDIKFVEYSLWKVCVVRSFLKGVFCYRKQSGKIPDLLQKLTVSVMSEPQIVETKESLLLVIGTRAKAETFPDGFFHPYYWDFEWRRFRNLL